MRKTASPAALKVPAPVKNHWNELRELYVLASPRQRLGPIVDRLQDPLHWGPNLLVMKISAVVVFARTTSSDCVRLSNRSYSGIRTLASAIGHLLPR
jgi:hypothetical protein